MGKKPFTTGERRGLLVLLIILSVTMAIAYVTNNTGTTGMTGHPDTTVSIQTDSSNDSLTKPSDKRHRTKRKKASKAREPLPTPRNPLSEPVPQL